MSVILYIIMPNNLGFEHNDLFASNILSEIEQLKLAHESNDDTTFRYFLDSNPTHLNNSIVTNYIDIETSTPYSFFITEKGVSISTYHRYSTIYENYKLNWFENFRKDIIKIANLFKSEEWFYMADNLAKISIFETDLMENLSYQQSKENLLKTFGNPLTDFKQLDYSKLDYNTTAEWFLDSVRN